MRIVRSALKKLPYLLLLGIIFPLPCSSKNSPATNNRAAHGYYMSKYEKGNIDTIIIAHAKECRTVMFGEIHDSIFAGSPPPIADSHYVISILPQLGRIGYEYLALEVDQKAPKQTHSSNILRFYADYRNGIAMNKKHYLHAKPGWIELLKNAMDLGFKVRFIGASARGIDGDSLRDKRMFENLKRKIFDKDEKAKVLVFIGADHILGSRTPHNGYRSADKRKPLGALLDEYTDGRNFTVYMGYPGDTPEGCDLFISHFIWESFQ